MSRQGWYKTDKFKIPADGRIERHHSSLSTLALLKVLATNRIVFNMYRRYLSLYLLRSRRSLLVERRIPLSDGHRIIA